VADEAAVDTRLARLKAELDEHARVASYLGLDFGRPVRSLADGYPENAIALVGKITERLLRQLWIHHGAPGTPNGRTLRDLILGCRPYIRSHRVLEALHEIQRLRNRSAHDRYPVADEDGLIALRRLLDVLAWYTSTGSGALTRHAPRLSPAAAAKAEASGDLHDLQVVVNQVAVQVLDGGPRLEGGVEELPRMQGCLDGLREFRCTVECPDLLLHELPPRWESLRVLVAEPEPVEKRDELRPTAVRSDGARFRGDGSVTREQLRERTDGLIGKGHATASVTPGGTGRMRLPQGSPPGPPGARNRHRQRWQKSLACPVA